MAPDEILLLLSQGEGTRIEFKESTLAVPASFYETVCAFLNKEGGTVLLGVTDDGEVQGIARELVERQVKSIVTAGNDPDLIQPPTTLQPVAVELEAGQWIIVVRISVSSQVHMCRRVHYDRENDSDLRLTDEGRIKELYFRKRQVFTESQIYRYLRVEDLDPNLFVKGRRLIRAANPAHPWLAYTDEELLRSSLLHRRDFQTGEEGLTLAAALIFGRDEVIQSILPAYKVEALVRRDDLDRYDDRLTLRTNLIDTYLELMAFVRKHLPDRFVLIGDQRVDVRERIFRELVGNIIVHREYTNGLATELIIYRDRVVATNPNRAMFRGALDVQRFSPYAKNPDLRRFFTAFGWTDEIGSGVRNTVRFLAYYVPGATPLFLENDVFRTEIPLVAVTLGQHGGALFNWLGLPDAGLLHAQPGLTQVALDSNLAGKSWARVLESLVPSWQQKGIKLPDLEWPLRQPFTKVLREKVPSSPTKGTKLLVVHGDLFADTPDGVTITALKLLPAWSSDGSAVLHKKSLVLMRILALTAVPIKLDQLLDWISYSNRNTFRRNYLLPLLTSGLLARTNPSSPTDPEQRYVLTAEGRVFLGGRSG